MIIPKHLTLFFLISKSAFDKVSPGDLIDKIRSQGIVGNVDNWLEKWLKDRQQLDVISAGASAV